VRNVHNARNVRNAPSEPPRQRPVEVFATGAHPRNVPLRQLRIFRRAQRADH